MKCSNVTEASGNSNTSLSCVPGINRVKKKRKIELQINHVRTNAAQTRFRIATSQPNGNFVFLLTRLSDYSTNVVLKFKVFANHGPAAVFRGRGGRTKNAAVAKPACATTRHPDVTRCARKHAKRRDLHRQIQPHGVQAILCLELVNPAAARFALGIFPARLDALFEQEVIGALLQL